MKKVGYSNTSFSLEDDLLWRFKETMNKRRMRNKTAILSDLIERWIENDRVARKGYVTPTISGDPSIPISRGSTIQATHPDQCVLQVHEQVSILSEGEGKILSRVLRLIRDGRERVLAALYTNLDVFEVAQGALSHGYGGTDTGQGRAGEQADFADEDREVAEIEQSIREAEQGEDESPARKRRTPRKNRGRG